MADIVTRIIFDDTQALKSLDNMNTSLDKVEQNLIDVQKITGDGMKEVAKETDKGAKAVKGFEDNTTKAAESTKTMGEATHELTGDIQILGFNVTQAVGGLKAKAAALKGVTAASAGTSKALKVLRLAIIGTGIGALIIALTSVISFFTKTQRGADLVSKSMAGLGAVVDVIVDRFSAFGETLVNVFSDPKKAVADLAKAIKTNLVDRAKGIGDLFKGVGKVMQAAFNLDFDAVAQGFKDIADAAVLASTGFTPEEIAAGFDTITESIKGLNDEISREAKLATDLADRENKLRDARIKDIEVRAELNKIVAEARLLAVDEEAATVDRLNAIDLAIKTEEQLAVNRRKLAQENADIITAQVGLGESLAEDEQAAAEARAAIIDIDTATALAQKRLITQRNVLLKLSAKEALDAAKEALRGARELLAKELEEMPNLTVNAIAKTQNAIDQIDNLVIPTPDIADPETEIQQFMDKVKGIIEEGGPEIAEAFLVVEEVFGDVFTGIVDKQISENQRLIDSLSERRSELESALDEELGLQEDGLANNVKAKQEELKAIQLAEEEAAKKAAELEKKKLVQEKASAAIRSALALAEQFQNITTAGTRLIGEGAKLPFPANLIAIAASIAALVGFISSIKQLSSAAKSDSFHEGGFIGGDGNPWRSDRYGRGHRVEDSNIVLGGDEFVVNGRTTSKHRGFLEQLNAGYFDNMNLANEMNSGFRKRDNTINQRAAKRNQRMLNIAMAGAMSQHSNSMINYMAKQGQYYSYGPGDTVVHVTPTKIQRSRQ